MTSTINSSSGSGLDDDPLSGIHFVDSSAHFSEPVDMWSSGMSESSRVRVSQPKTIDGESDWYLGDEWFATVGSNSIRRDARRCIRAEHDSAIRGL